MKIGIYGGTFDPPHLGHMEAAKAAVRAIGLDKLLFVPAARPPHKDLPTLGGDGAARMEMTALMADGVCLETGRREIAAASDVEFSRPGLSYTADTLALLRERYPGDELWLLMGTDMFLTFPEWREPERIASLASLAAFARADGDEGPLEEQAERIQKNFHARVELVRLDRVTEVSSTEVRELLSTDREKAREFLWCQVYGYILRSGLYGVNADLKRLPIEDLRCASWSMVKAKRVPHIRGTEEEAVRLAKRWGADPELARRAGILHDCTKYLDLDAQLKLCEKYDIVLDELERKTVKLLHSKTGAAIAKHVFGEGAAVCEAIYWHTTGKADMTTLEKVLYLADYIEPSREDFEGLGALRKLAYEDLDAALLMGCELTIQDMRARGNQVHHNTREAQDYLKGKLQ
ncbi:MAG: nicotinate (nicotinamide) nucleotide adenylyltransferase [Clostridia bacterium]|nr:nicotinate (nicotinamide) nucleotide adenylyltransferase [Clostridia bacterium]